MEKPINFLYKQILNMINPHKESSLHVIFHNFHTDSSQNIELALKHRQVQGPLSKFNFWTH